jgi:hypothetical protein
LDLFIEKGNREIVLRLLCEKSLYTEWAKSCSILSFSIAGLAWVLFSLGNGEKTLKGLKRKSGLEQECDPKHP